MQYSNEELDRLNRLKSCLTDEELAEIYNKF